MPDVVSAIQNKLKGLHPINIWTCMF